MVSLCLFIHLTHASKVRFALSMFLWLQWECTITNWWTGFKKIVINICIRKIGRKSCNVFLNNFLQILLNLDFTDEKFPVWSQKIGRCKPSLRDQSAKVWFPYSMHCKYMSLFHFGPVHKPKLDPIVRKLCLENSYTKARLLELVHDIWKD